MQPTCLRAGKPARKQPRVLLGRKRIGICDLFRTRYLFGDLCNAVMAGSFTCDQQNSCEFLRNRCSNHVCRHFCRAASRTAWNGCAIPAWGRSARRRTLMNGEPSTCRQSLGRTHCQPVASRRCGADRTALGYPARPWRSAARHRHIPDTGFGGGILAGGPGQRARH